MTKRGNMRRSDLSGGPRSADRPLRSVTTPVLRGGGSIFAPFKFHWWELRLECGHVVERRCRWAKVDRPNRGWAAQHHAPSLDRLLDAPARVRCEECPAIRHPVEV